MCRLVGYLAPTPVRMNEVLLDPPNSLQRQAVRNPHGWGVAAYAPGSETPVVKKSVAPACQDSNFETVSKGSAAAFIAHVRFATVGGLRKRNCHPFTIGRWSFAHNGTVHRVAEIRSEVLAEIDPDLRGKIRGGTDSEACFYLFLTRLRRLAVDFDQPTAKEVARSLVEVSDWLAALADRPGEVPTATNFLATDGHLMVAMRRHRTLAFSTGDQQPFAKAGDRVDHLLVASAPLSRQKDWRQLAEDSIVAIDLKSRLQLWNMSDLATPET